MHDAPRPFAETVPSCACCAGEAERLARRLAVLRDLTEAGMEIVATLRVEAQVQAQAQTQALSRGEAEPGGRACGDLALTFSRVARAVRQTLALEARLVRDHQDDARAAPRPAEARPPARSSAVLQPERLGRHYEISRVIDHTIESGIADVGESERLFDAMTERLEDLADRPDFMDRPVGAVIAEICHALGLKPDWSLWADEAWAQEEAQTKPPGSPYATRPPPPTAVVAASAAAVDQDPGWPPP